MLQIKSKRTIFIRYWDQTRQLVSGSFPSVPGEASIFIDSHDAEVVLDEQTAFAHNAPDSPVAEEVSINEVEENSIEEADALAAGKRSDLSPQSNASPVPSCEGMPKSQDDILESDEAAQGDDDSENEEKEQSWWCSFLLQNAELVSRPQLAALL